jgi:hypothetical protein
MTSLVDCREDVLTAGGGVRMAGGGDGDGDGDGDDDV